MQRFRKILLSLLIVFSITFFVGCSYSISYKEKLSHYTGSRTQSQEIIEIEDLDGLSLAEKKQLISEKYVEISFTVMIYEVVEKTISGEPTTTERAISLGSGFIVHSGGYILTNDHVIEKVTAEPKFSEDGKTKTYYKIYVTQDEGETLHDAKLLWNNERFDMAILIAEDFAQLDAANLKDRTIYCKESEKIQHLEEIITVGTQISERYDGSVTQGTISSEEWRTATSGGVIYQHLIQHTAPINHGNSGGALIDLDGNVIGLNTLGYDGAHSLFFAVSIYPAIAILPRVVENNLYGDTTEELAFGFMGTDKVLVKYSSGGEIEFKDDGVYVDSVLEECIINNLEEGDIIIGTEITTEEKVLNFEIKDQNMLLYSRIWLLYAQSANVKVIRNGTQQILSVNLGE